MAEKEHPKGRRLWGIIVGKKELVYKPTSYDIPWRPYKCLAFALHLIIAMLDARLITPKHFDGDERWLQFYGLVHDLVRRIEGNAMLGLEDVPGDPIRYLGPPQPGGRRKPACP